jgi:hypothetical protein
MPPIALARFDARAGVVGAALLALDTRREGAYDGPMAGSGSPSRS